MLTKEQQDIIENSIWVVNTALKKQGLQKDEDLRQDAIVYMCKCLERFDDTKGIKWTTFAYKNIYLYVKRQNAQEKIRESLTIHDENRTIILDFNESEQKDIFQRLLKQCSPFERKILQLKVQGYTFKEIAKKLNCSVSNITLKLKNIKGVIHE